MLSSSVSQDGFLSQQVWLFQPHKGYRIAIDPIFLAASLPLLPNTSVLDCGCGVGAITCFLLFREPSLQVVGVEKNKEILELAIQNHDRNGFRGTFHPIHTDIETFHSEQQFDHVVSNPPFYPNRTYQCGPSSLKSEAHQEAVPLAVWIAQMLRHLKKGGLLTVILPPERLADFFQADIAQLGHVRLFPLWSSPQKPARRVIVQGQKGNKGPLKFLPGLVLHDQNGAYTQEADAILRGETLDLDGSTS